MPAAGIFHSVRRYTRFVLFSKWLLWIAAGGLFVAVVVMSWVNTGDGSARLVFTNPQQSQQGEEVMLRPHYQSVDKNDQPFNVTADTATQKDAETVLLKNLNADMSFKDSRWAALSANEGTLRTNKKKLDLAGAVNMFYDGGYEMRTELALVDMAAGSIEGPKPVEGQGPSGTLKADRFKVREKGKVLYFEGNVKVTLNMDQ